MGGGSSIFFFVLLHGSWGLLGPCACQTSILLLSHISSPLLTFIFFKLNVVTH